MSSHDDLAFIRTGDRAPHLPWYSVATWLDQTAPLPRVSPALWMRSNAFQSSSIAARSSLIAPGATAGSTPTVRDIPLLLSMSCLFVSSSSPAAAVTGD